MVWNMKDDEDSERELEPEEQVLSCGNCRRSGGFSKPVSVLLVYAPGLERPYPLVPDAEYRVCNRCDAIFALIDKACEHHATMSQAGPWTRAIVIFDDGAGLDVAAKREETRPTQKMAMA